MNDRVIANSEQADFWDGDEGEHWVRNQLRYDAITGAFNEVLLDAAAIGGSDRVLDLGCGNGQTTRLAAGRARDGHGVGVDLSSAMLERARRTASDDGIANVTFELGDAQIYPFASQSLDVAISRFGIMFFDDPAAAFANVAQALRPGGRLAFVCWQDALSNEYIAVPAAALLEHVPLPDLGAAAQPGPFSLADPDRIKSLLKEAGFEEIAVSPVEASLRLGDDADDTVEFMASTDIARGLLASVDPPAAALALDAVRAVLRPHERPDGLFLGGAAWLVTARR